MSEGVSERESLLRDGAARARFGWNEPPPFFVVAWKKAKAADARKEKAAERKEVTDFVNYWMKEGGALAQEVGYIALPDDVAKGATERFSSRTVGSVK